MCFHEGKILDPDPAKGYGSERVRIRNNAENLPFHNCLAEVKDFQVNAILLWRKKSYIKFKIKLHVTFVLRQNYILEPAVSQRNLKIVPGTRN
jgi:hypothetical protein